MLLRYAALGDSATFGIGDPVVGGYRGWSRILAGALETTYEVSCCNIAVSGSTSATVLRHQLAGGVAHRPDLASLVVGVNDTMRAGWEPGRLRRELLVCAELLCDAGATLLTANFHDHGEVFELPGALRRLAAPLRARPPRAGAGGRRGAHRRRAVLRPALARARGWSAGHLA